MTAEDRKADWRERRRKKREAARAAGLCIICFKTMVFGGRSTCSACGDRANEAKRRRTATKKADAT